MTTSCVTDQVNQELSLDDMQSISGGLLVEACLVAGGFTVGLITDQVLEGTTGRGLSEHFGDAVEYVTDGINDLVNGTDSNGDRNVTTTGS